MVKKTLVKGIQKLLDDSSFSASRRKFLKESGAAATMTAMPGSVLKGIAKAATPTVAIGAALKNAPPWMKVLVSSLNQASSAAKPITLKSGAVIEPVGKFRKFRNWVGPEGKGSNPDGLFGEQTFSVRTKTDNLEEVVLENNKNDITVSFKMADFGDDYGGLSDQHLVFNKTTGKSSHIDDNLSMEPGGADVRKDDWIEQGVGMDDIYKSTERDYRKNPVPGVIKSGKDLNARDYDKLSKPDTEGRYDDMFEDLIDTFSPFGNLFRSAERAKSRQKRIQKEEMARQEKREVDWEEQFRGGHGMHGYARGGMKREKLGKRSDQAIKNAMENSRMTRLRNMSDVEAMARMMYAESGKKEHFRDAKAIGHVIANRAGFKIDDPVSTFVMNPRKNLSLIKRAIAGDPAGEVQFTPFRSTKNTQFWDVDMTEDNPYYKYAADILRGNAKDFTGGATMFDLNPYKYDAMTPGLDHSNKYWDYSPAQFAPDEYGRTRPHEGPHSFWSISARKNRGGMAKKFTVDDAVAMIRAAPQSFVGGGLVKKLFAPKVLGKLSGYKPKVTGEIYKPPEGPYTITDASGVRILDKEFKTLTAAQKDLKKLAKLRTQDASEFKIVGARPPKTAEGVWESAPAVDLGMVGKELPPAKPGAMFWGSREKIINAPYESMTGSQWLRYLKGIDEEEVFKGIDEATAAFTIAKEEGKILTKKFSDMMKTHRVKDKSGKMVSDVNHPDVIAASKALQIQKTKIKKASDDLARLKLSQREGTGKEFHDKILGLRKAQEQFPPIRDMELNDAGLAPHLTKKADDIISKEQLVKDFDNKLAPDISVVALGSKDMGSEAFDRLTKMNLQAYRPGPLRNVLQGIQDRQYEFKNALDDPNKIKSVLDDFENLVENNFGVKDSIRKGFPQKFPYELKSILHNIAMVSDARLGGFGKYADRPQYRGTQTIGGGENYREFVFKYKHPSGSLRKAEPYMTYGQVAKKQDVPAHFTDVNDRDTMGGFMHMRVSDRTDEFGRRILHIEEIQSDMHQPVNKSLRTLKQFENRWKEQGLTPAQGYADLNQQAKMDYDRFIKKSKYATRGDLMKADPVGNKANEEQFKLILAQIDELQAMPVTKARQIRINRLNKERDRVREIIEDKKAKLAKTKNDSGIPMGPLSKSEDYDEFAIKYALKVAEEGGYDGVSVSTGIMKNTSAAETLGSAEWKGNMVAYGPIMQGAMKKVAKKSNAKFIESVIIDDNGRPWKIPLIWLDDASRSNVAKGLPIYKRGGIARNG